MKTLRVAIVAALILTAAFLAGRWTKHCPAVPVSSRVDTVTVRDTVRDTVLVPTTRYLVRLDTIRVKIAGDTVYVDAEVPIEQRTYQTDDYRAVVEGFRPSLVSMEVYRQTHYITKLETIEVPDRKRWGIGLNASYGATLHDGKVMHAPFLGVGVQYNLIRW
jgi:hypothetical protein